MRTERQLAAVLDESVPDRSPIGRLAAAARQIASIDEPDELTAAIPELARSLCSATAAALLRVGASGRVEFLSSGGAPFQAQADRLLAMARAVLGWQSERRNGDPSCSRDGAHRFAVLPLAHGGREPLLAVERKPPDDCLSGSEIEHLAVYAFFAGAAFARARASAALRETVAREAAMLRAVRDGVIALDRSGTVRALNQCAATALGVRRDEIVGRVLREVPGLAPLAFALAGAPDPVRGPVSVPRGRVAIRSQVHEGGIVATVRDLAPAAGQSPANAVRYTFRDFVGKHPALMQVLEHAERAAQLDFPILISGESGTGKELLAQAIHSASPRASAPFVGINVIAIPRELLESELFGYEGGAFTGARSSGRIGSFGEADRGTLLLDEIGDMPLELQGKLLRVLQERVVQRVGGRVVPVLARVIATTNCDLEQAVRSGRFRLDLFHRLRVVHLHLPALRERRGDVRLLIERHLGLHAERCGGGAVTIEPAVLAAMEAYDWPGNVRELLNVVDSELALLPAGRNALSVVPGALRRPAAGAWGSPASTRTGSEAVPPLSETVRRACREAVARHGGNVSSAARALGIAKGTLYRKIGPDTVASSNVSDLEPASKPARDPQP
jgi:transcriptional regulator with PAS, ATPase and Fis domain